MASPVWAKRWGLVSEMREKLADLAHDTWSRWMEHLFDCCTFNPDCSAVIPADKVKRWQRQRITAYSELPETEKESDREEADKVLKIIEGK